MSEPATFELTQNEAENVNILTKVAGLLFFFTSFALQISVFLTYANRHGIKNNT